MPRVKPKVFAFYSYKGGTGRTTASANVAALLALSGCRVLCLDLDLEGPGIGIVFNIAEAEPFPLQGYFEGKTTLTQKDFIAYKEIKTPRRSGLWVLPASTKLAGTVETERGGRLLGQLKRLLDLAEQELKVNAVIIDTENGFGNLSALSMYVSDCVVALYRYSRQHVLGTAKVSDFVSKNNLEFLPVASCVPPDTLGEKDKYIRMVDTFYSGPKIEIAEDDSLKWRERVIVGGNKKSSPALNGYKELAKQLVDMM